MEKLPDLKNAMIIKNPLVIIMREEDETNTVIIHAPPKYTHQHYGLIICDLVRHVANAFKVEEDAVWEWVDKERARPTTDIKERVRQ